MADAPAPSGERGRGGFGRGFGGRGRGDRGRGRGRGRGQKEEEKWVPCTKLGRLVQQVVVKAGHLATACSETPPRMDFLLSLLPMLSSPDPLRIVAWSLSAALALPFTAPLDC